MSGTVLRRGQSLMKHKDIFTNRELFGNLGIDPRKPDMKDSELRKGRQELEAQIEVERNSAAVALAKSRNPSSGIISSRAKNTLTALTKFFTKKDSSYLSPNNLPSTPPRVSPSGETTFIELGNSPSSSPKNGGYNSRKYKKPTILPKKPKKPTILPKKPKKATILPKKPKKPTILAKKPKKPKKAKAKNNNL
jgi:hypothetical protein